MKQVFSNYDLSGVRFYPAEIYDTWFSLNKSAISRKDRYKFEDYLKYKYPLILEYLEKKELKYLRKS